MGVAGAHSALAVSGNGVCGWEKEEAERTQMVSSAPNVERRALVRTAKALVGAGIGMGAEAGWSWRCGGRGWVPCGYCWACCGGGDGWHCVRGGGDCAFTSNSN